MTYKITLWLRVPALFVFCTLKVCKMTRHPWRTSRPTGEPVATHGEINRVSRIVTPIIAHRYLTIWKDLDDLTGEVLEAHETVSSHNHQMSHLQTRRNMAKPWTLTRWPRCDGLTRCCHDGWSDVLGQQTHSEYTSLISVMNTGLFCQARVANKGCKQTKYRNKF